MGSGCGPDVTSEAPAKQAVDAAVEKFGRIDVLVNNAGYSGVLYVMRAALPLMRRQR